MILQPGQVLPLTDTQGRQLGQVTVERQEAGQLLGSFTPGPAFAEIEPLFREFEELANDQVLSLLDAVDASIDALGLRLRLAEGSNTLEVHDVQLWSDGGISCKLRGSAVPGVNGVTEVSSATEPERPAYGSSR